MRKQNSWDANLLIFVFVSLILTLFFINESLAQGRKARTVHLDENTVTTIWVKPLVGTILRFPAKPKKAVLGADKSFSLEYVENEIFVASVRSNAHTNMHVYLLGRRYSFKLITSSTRRDEIVNVRDAKDKGLKVDLR